MPCIFLPTVWEAVSFKCAGPADYRDDHRPISRKGDDIAPGYGSPMPGKTALLLRFPGRSLAAVRFIASAETTLFRLHESSLCARSRGSAGDPEPVDRRARDSRLRRRRESSDRAGARTAGRSRASRDLGPAIRLRMGPGRSRRRYPHREPSHRERRFDGHPPDDAAAADQAMVQRPALT